VRARDVLLGGNVLWLAIVSLLNDAASEMIYPLLPLFLVGTLGAGPAFLGLVEGIAESASSLLKLGSGWVSDRFGRRKPLVLAGYGIAAVIRPLIALASLPWHVLAIRFSDRLGKGLRSAPRDALLAESVPAGMRGRAFGFHRAADHAGAVIGPLLASALLLAFHDRLRPVFLLAAVPGLLAVIVLAARVRETRGRTPGARAGLAAPGAAAAETRSEGDPATNRAPGHDAPRRGALGPPFLRYLAVLAIFTLGNATDAFLLLRANALGVTAAAIPLLWAVHHVSKMVWNVPGGAIADRFGPRRAIIAGWALYALVYAGFAFATTAWHVWGLFIVYGLFYGLTEAPEKALVAALAGAEQRGLAFGAFHGTSGLAALPASVLFGLLWSAFGPAAAFLTGAGLALTASLLLALLVPGAAPAEPA
jgi:MFS family permease